MGGGGKVRTAAAPVNFAPRRAAYTGHMTTADETVGVASVASDGEESTRAFGERLGALLRAGDVVLLRGELGSGKTRLAQGIGRGLGCTGPIASPTFVLVNEHLGRERLYHADLYRIAESAELDELGLREEAERGVLVVEWPERADGLLPDATLTVELEPVAERERLLRLRAGDDRGRAVLAALGLA